MRNIGIGIGTCFVPQLRFLSCALPEQRYYISAESLHSFPGSLSTTAR